MVDVIADTLIDFAKLLPLLFLSYLLMEFIEHKIGDRARHALEKAGNFAPLLGGAVGAVPQCGFSAAAAGLYAGRVISAGTLIAVFLSTSDEMLPVILGHSTDGRFAVWSVVRILAGKMAIGILCGILIDQVIRILKRHRHATDPAGTVESGDDHGHGYDHDDEDGAHAHIGEICNHAHCGCKNGGIWRSALMHTLEIGAFILITCFVLNTVIHFVGEERLGAFLQGRGPLIYLFSAMVGLIPNCAASVVITELYISGALSVGAMYAGLLTGAGVGVLVLCRVNRSWRENLVLIAGLYLIGASCGALIDLFGFSWMGLKFY